MRLRWIAASLTAAIVIDCSAAAVVELLRRKSPAAEACTVRCKMSEANGEELSEAELLAAANSCRLRAAEVPRATAGERRDVDGIIDIRHGDARIARALHSAAVNVDSVPREVIGKTRLRRNRQSLRTAGDIDGYIDALQRIRDR